MERLARCVLAHRLLVGLVWLVLAGAGIASTGVVTDRLSFDFSLPGQPGDTAEKQLMQQYGVSTFDAYVPVVTVPEGDTVQGRAEDVARVFDGLEQQFPQVQLVDLASSGDPRFVTDDGRSTFALVLGPPRPGSSRCSRTA